MIKEWFHSHSVSNIGVPLSRRGGGDGWWRQVAEQTGDRGAQVKGANAAVRSRGGWFRSRYQQSDAKSFNSDNACMVMKITRSMYLSADFWDKMVFCSEPCWSARAVAGWQWRDSKGWPPLTRCALRVVWLQYFAELASKFQSDQKNRNRS